MSDSYIPAEDAAALTWMTAFSTNISANPSLYQLSGADSANIASVVADFAAAQTVATNELTRTSVSINARDAARNVAEQLCRTYAIQIKYNAGISDEDKIAVGVRPPTTSRQPINVPASSPLLNVLGATPGSHTIRYADTSTPESGKKPFGAAQLQLFVAIGTAPTTTESDGEFYGAFTKNPIGVGFSEEDDGKVASYFAALVLIEGRDRSVELAGEHENRRVVTRKSEYRNPKSELLRRSATMPAAGIIGRRSGKRRNNNRDTGLRNVARPTAISIVSATPGGDNLTIVFNQPVSLNGIPQFLKNGAIAPTAASLTSPTTLVLTYPAAGPIATDISISSEDPSIRNSSGGFVTPSTVEV